MAKKNGTISETDTQKLVTAKALERYAAGVLATMDDASARLPSGVYTVSVSIVDPICGDITVGPEQEVAASEGPSVKAEDVLASLCAGKSQGEVAEFLRPALDRLGKTGGKDAVAKTAAAKVAASAAYVESAMEAECRKRGLWKKKAASTRAGKTEGQPVGRCHVIVNKGEIEIEVDEN